MANTKDRPCSIHVIFVDNADPSLIQRRIMYLLKTVPDMLLHAGRDEIYDYRISNNNVTITHMSDP